MINEENLNKLYEGIVNGNELTTKELNSYGFNSKDLADLIEQGNLQRIKRGYYSFQSIDELFYYGKKLISKKEYDKAAECFKKCYELDSTHSKACFQLFLQSINKKDYESAFQYFEVLSNTDNPYYIADNNFYLYLLNIITDVPEKHKEYAKYLKIEDIRVDFHDKRYQDIPQQNKIRIAVLQRKFPYALKQLTNLTAKHNSLTTQDVITRILLYQAINVETISKNTLIKSIKNKEYNKIAGYLEEKQKNQNLSFTDSYTLKLANEIINLQEAKQVPKKTIFKSENLFEAIDGYNYELALLLSNNYNEKNNINNSENALNLLLTDICNLIHQISVPTQSEIEKTTVTEEIEILEEEPLATTESINDSTTTFSNVVSYLMKSDLENAFSALRNYMDSIDKRKYEFLIIDLIKLSLIEKDIAFTKPMIALTYISRENFKFDISNYIQNFYVTLSQNKFDEARIYLDIISKANKLVQDCILTEELQQVLDNTEKMIGYKQNNATLDKVEETIEKSKKVKTTKTEDSILTENPDKPIIPIKTEEINETPSNTHSDNKNNEEILLSKAKDNEKKLIEKNHQLLLNGEGIVLLKPMSSEKCKSILETLKEYRDIDSFIIGENENKQIVLRYKPYISQHIDINNLIETGNQAYNEGNYDYCIESYLQLLKFGKPKTIVYAKLGLAYLKKYKKKTAINYLTIATYLSKQENGNFDFTELIACLKGLMDKTDRKPEFKMNIKDFDNDINNYYGIKNIDKITTHILESGLDVESACQNLGMTDEQIDTIRLIYAKEYYSQGNYEKGDQFLKTVEKSKNKTKFTLKLFEEIRRNKKFYINRANDKPQQLTLTLQPNK